MARRLILIPPSEGKVGGGDGVPWGTATTTPSLTEHRAQVIEALSVAMGGARRDHADVARLLGARGDTLDRAIEANRSIETAPTLPAIERYDGVLYQHLDAPNLATSAKTRLSRSVRIVSGLWGVVAPDEAIPDYRLKMSASLPGLGKLSAWWREAVSDEVAEQARGRELWDLLPLEHAAAVVVSPAKTVTTAVFLEPDKSGALTAVAHWNKALKGSLVAHLIAHPSTSVDDLADWDHPGGYRLDPSSLAVDDRRRCLRFVKVS